ncbi:MAG: hypothetical protein HF312_15615 [Ignavibacteria bacterium]|jgi:3D (Asp-Asp-Asp) domain-containing protein|nr:hypothetical protein [Ignavibacteria bacterium]
MRKIAHRRCIAIKRAVFLGAAIWHFLVATPALAHVKMKMRVTAYCNRGKTKSGIMAKQGCIASDPAIVPIGSTVYIPGYGYGKCVDTGRKVKGHHLDVWLPSRSSCVQWGNKKLFVHVNKKYVR